MQRRISSDKTEYYKFVNSLSTHYDEKIIEDSWKEEMDLHHEWWDDMDFVDKPQYIIDEDDEIERYRIGRETNKFFNPKENEIFVLLEVDDIGKVLISDIRPEKCIGTIIKSASEKYLIDTIVVFDSKKINRRFNYNDNTYLILKETEVLGIWTLKI